MVADVFCMYNYTSVNCFMYFVKGLEAMVGSPMGGKNLSSEGSNLRGWKGFV